MPVEIRELNVKMTIESKPEKKDGRDGLSSDAPSVNLQAIVAECVEQVMQILSDKREP